MNRLARYAWWVLAINLAVILWGAFVRASGSGAGCGSHWPLCNGVVIPRGPAVATLIELTHRVTSGVALLGVVLLVVIARRDLPRGAAARTAAHLSLLFIVSEALVGAGLVLFEMVAHNASVARAWWISAHLVNTFLLLACVTLTAWYATGFPAVRWRELPPGIVLAAAALLCSTLALGVSGAITALGDTLYPVDSLRAGLAQDLDPASHLFVRLRAWHPVMAIAVGSMLLVATRALAVRAASPKAKHLARWCGALVVMQLIAGAANVYLLAPIPMQLLHLLLADLVWIALVLTLATAMAALPAVPAVPAVLAMAAVPLNDSALEHKPER